MKYYSLQRSGLGSPCKIITRRLRSICPYGNIIQEEPSKEMRPRSSQLMHQKCNSGDLVCARTSPLSFKYHFSKSPSPPAPSMQVPKGVPVPSHRVGKQCCSHATLKYVKKSNRSTNASAKILQGAVSLSSALSIMGVAAGVALGVLLMISIEGRLLSTRKLGNLGIPSPLVVTGPM